MSKGQRPEEFSENYKETSLLLDSVESSIEYTEDLLEDYKQELYRVQVLADEHPNIDYSAPAETIGQIYLDDNEREEEIQKRMKELEYTRFRIDETLETTMDMLLEHNVYGEEDKQETELRRQRTDVNDTFVDIDKEFQEIKKNLEIPSL